MGGKCQICGYIKCRNSLEIHHIDSEEKEISFQNIVSWERIYKELEKCILLCANCHREVHVGVTAIPIEYKKFDRELANFIRGDRSLRAQNGKKIETKLARIESKQLAVNRKKEFISNRKNLILNSGIDLTSWGWSVKVGKLLNISSQKASLWVKKYLK